MDKRLLVIVSMLLIFPLLAPTAKTWVYQDGTPEDAVFEKFGPRADKLLIKLYPTAENEWEALANGQIDTTDSPLSKTHYDMFTSPPLNGKINVVGYGPELAFSLLDINNANTSSSPVYPNPLSVLSFRQAIAHLVDRTWLDEIIGTGLYVPLWVPMSPALGEYYLDIPNPYPFDPATAEALLDLDGFPVNPGTGWRFWDRNHNEVEDLGEYLELICVIRVDHPDRRQVGDKIANELNNVNVRVNRIYATAAQARNIVMIERNFHLYTGGFNTDDPTYLYYCFHSSMIPQGNYNSVNDEELDFWLESLMNATTHDEAVSASRNAQQVFVDKSFKVPIWAYVNYKAVYRRYSGGTGGNLVLPDDGENVYRNNMWLGAVNMAGRGIDNIYSFLNMHPAGFSYGDGANMTIRHGFSSSTIGHLNPIYADLLCDQQVLNTIYDRLIRQDPYSPATKPKWIPWIAKNFTVGTYFHPIYGECTKVKVTLRTDVTWSDGTPLTTADARFTLVELDDILSARGLPPPWWGYVESILDFKILDPYNFEILFDYLSAEDVYFQSVLPWISETPMLPKHIWKPIAESGDPTTFAPDPNMIGSGPWRLKEYVSDSQILMVKNKPCSSVQTNLPGSVLIHSPYGYFRLFPLYVDGHFLPPYEYSHRILPFTPVIFNVTLDNLIREKMMVESISPVNLSDPVSSVWNETWPIGSAKYTLDFWIDEDLDEFLSPSDIIGMMPVGGVASMLEWHHVGSLVYEPPGPYIMTLSPVEKVTKYVYLDNNLVIGPLDLNLKTGTPHKEYLGYLGFVPGLYTFKTAIHIKEPNWNSWKLNCTWINYTFVFWVTVEEDATGSTLYDDIGLPTYPYKTQLHSPDIKVDLKDVFEMGRAYGSFPGHLAWDPVCDINDDYRIDLKDYYAVCKKYGWPY